MLLRQSVSVVAKDETITNCRFCGRNHPHSKCPAYGKTGDICKKANHFVAGCGQKRVGEMTDNSNNFSRSLDTLFADEVRVLQYVAGRESYL